MRRVGAYELIGEFARIYGWGFWEWHASMGFLARRGHASTLADGADPTPGLPVQIDLVYDRWSDYEFSNFESDFRDVARAVDLETEEHRRIRIMNESHPDHARSVAGVRAA